MLKPNAASFFIPVIIFCLTAPACKSRISPSTPVNYPDQTATRTFIQTSSFTASPTLTCVDTDVFTPTVSMTATGTFSYTATATVTLTRTFTRTKTITRTATETATVTFTATSTPTITSTCASLRPLRGDTYLESGGIYQGYNLYSYDESSRLYQEASFDGSDKPQSRYVYGYNGDGSLAIVYSYAGYYSQPGEYLSGTYYLTYDVSGGLVRTDSYDGSSVLYEYSIISYTDPMQPQLRDIYTPAGVLKKHYAFEYNASGFLSRIVFYNEPGSVYNGERTIEYDANDKQTYERDYNSSGTLFNYSRSYYGSGGELVLIELYSGTGTLVLYQHTNISNSEGCNYTWEDKMIKWLYCTL